MRPEQAEWVQTRWDLMHKDSKRKDSYICVECRYVRSGTGERCPKGHPLVHMGRNFKAPPKRNDRAWAAVASRIVDGKWRYGFGRSRRTHQTIQEQRQQAIMRGLPAKPGQYRRGYWPTDTFNASVDWRERRRLGLPYHV